MHLLYLLGVSILLTVTISGDEVRRASTDKLVVCYLGTWATYRPGEGKFDIEDIDASLCTHAVYGFAKLDNETNQIASFDPTLDIDNNGYGRFVGLKANNPDLKTLLAIGGWNEGSEKYSAMASDEESRKTFVQSAVNFTRENNFDGLDIDWEYPANRGGQPEDKKNFALLISELREASQKFMALSSASLLRPMA